MSQPIYLTHDGKPGVGPAAFARTLFVSDAQLRDRLWQGLPMVGDAYCAFSQAIDLAIHLKVRWVMSLGDLFDAKLNPAGPVVFLAGQGQKLYRQKIEFYEIQGNHDWQNPSWASVAGALSMHKLWMNGDYFDSPAFGFDFMRPDLFAEEVKAVPDNCRFLLTHQLWKELVPVAVVGCSFADVPDHITTLITGDYHEVILGKYYSRGEGRPPLRVFSFGSPVMDSLGETPDKNVYVMYGDGELKAFPLKHRPFHRTAKMTLETEFDAFIEQLSEELQPKTLAKTVDGLPPEIARPLYVVEYAANIPQAAKRLREAAKDRAWIVDRRFNPDTGREASRRGLADLDEDEMLNELGVRLAHPRRRELACALWKSHEPAMLLKEAWGEVLSGEKGESK